MGALMRPRVFVTQPITEGALKRLGNVADVAMNPDSNRILAKGKLCAALRKHDLLFALLHDTVDRDVLAANPKLRAVASMCTTPDRIDVAEATRRRIPVTVIPPVVHEATADIAFALILAVARRIVEGHELVRAGGFPGSQSLRLAGASVCGSTIGLVGAGRVGQAVARRAAGFSMRVLYFDPHRKSESQEREAGLTYVPFDHLLRESDFVSIHSPLNKETHHQIGARELGLMKRTAILINTARGPLVDEAPLIRALKAGQIAGAGLDVFEHEPRIAAALRKMPNVVHTPHLGSAVRALREQQANLVVDNIVALLDGRRPPDCVNPEVLDVKM
ncbi:MAG TPA: D-glycerate dehydrogenase [Xanthobacteraceae bacterium]|nr:D-glycerate dehydrogenase [Xanthobacteraceae bacterium]